MKLPGHDTWSPGTCTEKVDNRSYTVKVDDTEYRQNRRHIQKTDEKPIAEPELTETDEALPVPLEDSQAKPSDPSSETPATEHHIDDNTGRQQSNRACRAPVWHKDYVT